MIVSFRVSEVPAVAGRRPITVVVLRPRPRPEVRSVSRTKNKPGSLPVLALTVHSKDEFVKHEQNATVVVTTLVLGAASIQIPSEVAAVLRYYVYALRDPRDGRVFYVGKGIGDRINSHLREAGKDPESERAKLRTINDIEAAGLEVDLLFLRTGIDDEATAFVVEQAVIDAFAADGHALTNLVRGHHSGSEGLASLNATVARHRALPCPPIDAPLIMVKIQAGWRSDSTEQEVYDQTRGHWRIAPWVRERALY